MKRATHDTPTTMNAGMEEPTMSMRKFDKTRRARRRGARGFAGAGALVLALGLPATASAAPGLGGHLERSVASSTSVGLSPGTVATPRMRTAADDPAASDAGLTRAQQRKVAGEVGGLVGVGWAHGGLGITPELALEAGVRIKLPFGSLGIHRRGGYQRYTADGAGSFPCAEEGQEGPCIASNDGDWKWSLVEHNGRISLPISYRILPEERRVTPYILAAPGVFFQKSKVTSYDLDNTQFSAAFGIYGALGAQIRLGPGGLFIEGGYQWAALKHRITGDADMGAIRFALGYRVAL